MSAVRKRRCSPRRWRPSKPSCTTTRSAAWTPSELLALAVTGWVQGVRPEERAETARKLWAARKMVLAYLKADGDTERKKALSDFASAKNAVSIDEVAQIISMLPPPLAEEDPPTK